MEEEEEEGMVSARLRGITGKEEREREGVSLLSSTASTSGGANATVIEIKGRNSEQWPPPRICRRGARRRGSQ